MTPLFKKLNFKNNLNILVLNHPDSFNAELKEMETSTKVFTSAAKLDQVDFVMLFVTEQTEIDSSIAEIFPKLLGDAVIWFCYPKSSSKKYKTVVHRDRGWTEVASYGLEPVRMVAIDEDWSALRFRKVDYIKKITRRESFAMTGEAKNRTTQKGV